MACINTGFMRNIHTQKNHQVYSIINTELYLGPAFMPCTVPIFVQTTLKADIHDRHGFTLQSNKFNQCWGSVLFGACFHHFCRPWIRGDWAVMVSKKPVRRSVYTSTHPPMCGQTLDLVRTWETQVCERRAESGEQSLESGEQKFLV
jgi:hypothetical protein